LHPTDYLQLRIFWFAVKFYRRFRDNRLDGYTLHAIKCLDLPPSKAITIPNSFMRGFYP
jgi:conjugal transfer pilus assembly protein TraL